MLIALASVLGLLAASFLMLYRRALHERIVITEYAQFLLLSPKSYEEHRQKFIDYLADTGQRTAVERAKDARRVIASLAMSLFDKVMPGNVAARNAVVAAAAKSLTP
jgi:ferritin